VKIDNNLNNVVVVTAASYTYNKTDGWGYELMHVSFNSKHTLCTNIPTVRNVLDKLSNGNHHFSADAIGTTYEDGIVEYIDYIVQQKDLSFLDDFIVYFKTDIDSDNKRSYK